MRRRVIWARNVGSIDIQAFEEQDHTVTIEAIMTVSETFTIDPVSMVLGMTTTTITDQVSLALVDKIRDRLRDILDEEPC